MKLHDERRRERQRREAQLRRQRQAAARQVWQQRLAAVLQDDKFNSASRSLADELVTRLIEQSRDYVSNDDDRLALIAHVASLVLDGALGHIRDRQGNDAAAVFRSRLGRRR